MAATAYGPSASRRPKSADAIPTRRAK